MKNLIRSYKQAWASLSKNLGFTTTVITTMGVTLGALLCAVTLNHLLLIEPLPYPEQQRLFVANHELLGAQKESKGTAFTYPGLVHLYKSGVGFEKAAMLSYNSGVITSHSEQPLVNTTYVTPELHQLLASPMALGRKFEATEALETHNPVAVLSYNAWQQTFNGRTDILEQSFDISGVSYRIIGVLAEDFVEAEVSSVGRETDIWLPWDFNEAAEWSKESFGNISFSLKLVGKLKSDLNATQAEQLLTQLVNERWRQGVADIEFFDGWSIRMNLPSLKSVIIGDSETIALMLLAGILGLVMIAFANIANLFMSRTAEKQRQMAIKAAIGASKKHLFRGMLAETGILMTLSVVLALAVAQLGFYVMQQHLAALLPRIEELGLNLITFTSALLVCVVFALSFAQLSIRMVNYRALNSSLQSSGKGSGLQVSQRVRQILITSQVTLATVLVFSNFSLLNSALSEINEPLGFQTENIATLQLNFASTDIPTPEETSPIMTEVMQKLTELPQVEAVSQSFMPLDGFSIRALTNIDNNERYTPYFTSVDEHYFDFIQQPFLKGKGFSVEDREGQGGFVMVVNQAFARQLQPDGDVIGLQLATGAPQNHTIIGIVKDINLPNSNPAGINNAVIGVPRAYVPHGRDMQFFIIKFKSEQQVSRQQLGELISAVDPRYSVFDYVKAESTLQQALFTEITTAITTAVLACVVLFMAGIGLYGVLSYGIHLRQFELGARMAIGANRKHLIKLIVRDNAKAVMIGFVASLVLLVLLYVGFTSWLLPLLNWQLLPMMVLSLSVIIVVALFGCYWPLRRYINRPAIYSLRGSE